MINLTIVIALYNTEPYIRKCIESIYTGNALTMDFFEVIVINDGSTDNSACIVEELVDTYPNLTLLNKDNGGQSSARNIGFRNAQGKYVFCLDSDDSIDALGLSKALEYAIKNNLDLLPISLTKEKPDGSIVTIKKDHYPVISIPIEGGMFLNNYVIYGSMCRYLYKRSIYVDNNLYLTEGIYHEDEEFITKFISYSKLICYQKHYVYRQLVRENSTTNNKDLRHRLKLLNDLKVVILSLSSFSEKFDTESLVYMGIERKKEQLLISLFLKIQREKHTLITVLPIVKELKEVGLFPLNLIYSKLKFKMYAFYINMLWSKKIAA